MELWRSHELSHWEMAEEYTEIKNLDIHHLSTTEAVGEGDNTAIQLQQTWCQTIINHPKVDYISRMHWM